MRFRTAFAVAVLLLGCRGSEPLQEGPPTFSLEEVARFGSVDAGGSALTSVTSIALTDSTLLVLESEPPRVAVFNRNGEWLRDIGRQGDGPGELQFPTHLGVADGQVLGG